jgi:hypothetical protein
MTTVFSIMTPLGVCVGIALASVYKPESEAAAIVQGVFNALTAGG